MDRRGFLKLVAGAVALTQVPDVLSTLGPGDKTLAFHSPTMEYRLAIVDASGKTLWAPKLKSITKVTNSDGTEHLETRFRAEGIMVTESVQPVGSKLLDPQGRVVCERRFDGAGFVLCKGDKLCVSHSLVP